LVIAGVFPKNGQSATSSRLHVGELIEDRVPHGARL
jgi:hypothetical protein